MESSIGREILFNVLLQNVVFGYRSSHTFRALICPAKVLVWIRFILLVYLFYNLSEMEEEFSLF
jgi:hypothetical protein